MADLWTPEMQQQLLTLLAGIVLVVVTALGKAAWALVKAQIAKLENQALVDLLDRLVDAAEQKFGASTGAQKAAWVFEQLAKIGIKWDEATEAKVEAYLEAAVRVRNEAKATWGAEIGSVSELLAEAKVAEALKTTTPGGAQ